MTAIYKSSKGEVEITTMPRRYASNALAKLQREEPNREAEIKALEDHIASLPEDGESPPIGHNNPPPEQAEPPKWESIKTEMDDLLTEATNWADGAEIENQNQADAVARLRQLLQGAASLAEAARVGEKAPLDKKIAEIQDRYNAYIAPMKNKTPGSVSKAVLALGNQLSEWLIKLEKEKNERVQAARGEAEKAQAAAIAARKDMNTSTDLTDLDIADALLGEAEEKTKTLRSVEREKVQAKGGSRAMSLRTHWEAQVTDRRAALLHYIKQRPEAFNELVQSLADQDARSEATRREIPGVVFKQIKKAA